VFLASPLGTDTATLAQTSGQDVRAKRTSRGRMVLSYGAKLKKPQLGERLLRLDI